MPKLTAQMLAQDAVNKIFTRYQQAVQSIAEDMEPDDFDVDVLTGALHNYADSALNNIARETANEVLRAGRGSGFGDAVGDETIQWRRSAVLDDNTCDPCDAADGTAVDFDDDLSAICEGGPMCRCILFAELP